MATHVKPTKEQLEKERQASLKKLEELEKNPPKPTPSPSPSHAPSGSPSASPSPSAATSASPSASPSPSKASGSPSASPSPSMDEEEAEKERLRKKASASAREAQVLHSRTKKYDEAVEEAEKVEPPTNKDMEERYGKDEWEDMSEGNKQMARDAFVANKRFEIMSKASKEGRDIDKWNTEVDKFITDPKVLIKHPELEGKAEEFKEFATKPTRRGLDFDDLVLAFNGELALNPPKKNKGAMFEKGVGGDKKNKPKPNDGMLSAQQGRALMKTDYKKYKELLIAGKIRNE